MKKEIKFNHKRGLEDFTDQLKIVKEYGFNPISVTQMYGKDTFVFETNEEAEKAYNELDACYESRVRGWWNGKDEFLKSIKEYEEELNDIHPAHKTKVKVYWL